MAGVPTEFGDGMGEGLGYGISPDSHPTNSPRNNRFRPLSSAENPRVRPTYAEQFIGDAPPKVIANEAVIPFQYIPLFDPSVPQNLFQVLQLALPTPMTVGVVLGAYLARDDRFRPPSRLGAELDDGGAGFETGRYVVEWGLGEARNYVFTDLAPGSLQIPAAQYVSVFATARGKEVAAGCTAMPGFSIGEPSATYTTVMQRMNEDGTYYGTVQPFCREVSAGFSVQSTGGVALDPVLRVTLLNAFMEFNQYVIPSPAQPNGPTLPQPLDRVVLPGSCDRYALDLEDVAVAGSHVVATATLVQGIRL